MSSNTRLSPVSSPPILHEKRLSPSTPSSAAQSSSNIDYFQSKQSPSAASHTSSSLGRLSPSTPLQLSPSVISQSSPSSANSTHSTISGERSAESSDYLTPPERQDDDITPPYKPRSKSSDSLTMLWSRAKVFARKKRRKRRRRSKRAPYPLELTLNEARHQAYWWLPHHIGKTSSLHKFLFSPYGSSSSGSRRKFRNASNYMSHPAPPITFRRWSSTATSSEIFLSELSLRTRTRAVKRNPRRRHRSSTWTKGAQDKDIIQAVRTRLTGHNVTASEIAMPVTITLRRPSTSNATDSQDSSSTVTAHSTGRLLAPSQTFPTKMPVSTYLITNEDIDSITELIERTLRSRSGRKSFESSESVHRDDNRKDLRKPSVTPGGLLPLPVEPVNATTTSAQAQGRTNVLNEHNVSLADQRLPSTHEVIWANTGASTSSSSSLQTISSDAEFPTPDLSTTTPNHTAEDQFLSQHLQFMGGPKIQFSPHIKWAGQEPSSPEQPDSLERSPAPVRDIANSGAPLITPPEVISFPPLPSRKSTNDWITPITSYTAPDAKPSGLIPPIVVIDPSSPPPLRPERKLSVDVDDNNLSHPPSPSARASPVLRAILWGEEDGNDYNQEGRIRLPLSLARPHAYDIPKLGTAIGSSTHERRQSSVASRHIRIKSPSFGRPEDPQGPWRKVRKDSGWPEPVSPSIEGSGGTSIAQSRRASRAPSENPAVAEGIDADEEPCSDHDHERIYAAFTGTGKESPRAQGNQQNTKSRDQIQSSRGPSVDWIG